MNVNGLSGSSPDTGASAIRLWDEGVTWKDIEPQKNQYNFSGLDRVVSNAEKTGAADITYVLGMTPRWASIEQPLPPPIPDLVRLAPTQEHSIQTLTRHIWTTSARSFTGTAAELIQPGLERSRTSRLRPLLTDRDGKPDQEDI